MDLPLILSDLGGPVYERVEDIKGLEGVKIKGVCISSCTLYLGLRKTCVYPDAKLGFHGPSTRIGLPLSQEEFDKISEIMANHYPPKLRKWFLEEGRYIIKDYIVMTGQQVIEMGARPCD